MKRGFLVALAGFMLLALVGPGEAQVPGRGFSALLCAAGIDGEGTYELNPPGTIKVVVSDDTGSTATFDISHGDSGSTHIVSYVDTDGSGTINCGDVVTSVS